MAGYSRCRWTVTGLERRLGRLEVANGISVIFPTVFVSFGGLDDTTRGIVSAQIGNHTYFRAEAEADDAFCGRVVEADTAKRWMPINSPRVVILRNERLRRRAMTRACCKKDRFIMQYLTGRQSVAQLRT